MWRLFRNEHEKDAHIPNAQAKKARAIFKLCDVAYPCCRKQTNGFQSGNSNISRHPLELLGVGALLADMRRIETHFLSLDNCLPEPIQRLLD